MCAVLYIQVFDACAQFEESMINAKMEGESEEGTSENGELAAWQGRGVLMYVNGGAKHLQNIEPIAC